MTERRPIGLAPSAPRTAAGQDAAKYGARNPVVRWLLTRWFERLRSLIGPETGTVIDVGVGEGLSLGRILQPSSVSPSSVIAIEYRMEKARCACSIDGIDVVVADAGMVPAPDGLADLVLCIEVLEHLTSVDLATAELARLTRPETGRCVVSVPWEPWFRLGNLGRAKNIARLGNDPEHVQWFTARRLRQLLARHFASVRIERAFPWLIAETWGPQSG